MGGSGLCERLTSRVGCVWPGAGGAAQSRTSCCTGCWGGLVLESCLWAAGKDGAQWGPSPLQTAAPWSPEPPSYVVSMGRSCRAEFHAEGVSALQWSLSFQKSAMTSSGHQSHPTRAIHPKQRFLSEASGLDASANTPKAVKHPKKHQQTPPRAPTKPPKEPTNAPKRINKTPKSSTLLPFHHHSQGWGCRHSQSEVQRHGSCLSK